MIAQIFHFRKPSVSMLSKRLKMICDYEGLRVDSRALSLLCEKADCDIRTCLNTLQFLHRQQKQLHDPTSSTKKQSSRIITMNMIRNLNVGLKDTQKSIFTVWQELFFEQSTRQKELHRKLNGTDLYSAADNGTHLFLNLIHQVAFINRILPSLQANGEYDRVIQGCFEFYPSMQFRELRGFGSNISQLHDYIDFADRMSKMLYTTGRGFTEYMPYAIMAFHRFCVQPTTAKLEYPRQHSEFLGMKRQNEQIVRTVMLNLDATTRKWLSSGTLFCTDVVSPLLRILSPSLRPVHFLLDCL
jgi:chromosome transmission fidelity protein 18